MSAQSLILVVMLLETLLIYTHTDAAHDTTAQEHSIFTCLVSCTFLVAFFLRVNNKQNLNLFISLGITAKKQS